MTQIQPFEFAVREHGPRVLRVCRSLLGPGPDADDAWSETFLAALRAWPEMAQVVSMEGWLVRVAQRTCIDAIRARERRPVPTAYLPE
ncbi:MAG: sigma factor, partial [Nostocoides sp.]